MSSSYQPFTYLLTDLRSGAILGQLPISGVSFQKTLNGIGQFQGTVDLADPAFSIINPMNLTMPARTGLFVDYNGALVWGGIVWPRSYTFKPQSRQMSITASDPWSYFQQRIQATDYSAPPSSGITGPSPNAAMPIWNAASVGSPANEWDPVLIAWQVIADALSVTFGNIFGGLSIAANSYKTTTAYLASGTATPATDYINVTYPYSSLQSIDTVVSQLTQLGLGVGFDRGFDVAYSAGPLSTPVGTVNLSYPRRGRTFAQNNLRCDLSAARTYTFPEDGSQVGNVLYETGTSGAISAIENIYPIQQGYAILERVMSRSSLTSAQVLALLAEIGLSDLFLYSYPAVVPQVTVDLFGNNPTLGSFTEGDDILIVIPATDGVGNVFDPRFPNGLYQEWQITDWTAMVGDDGDSTLQMTLNQPPATYTSNPAI